MAEKNVEKKEQENNSYSVTGRNEHDVQAVTKIVDGNIEIEKIKADSEQLKHKMKMELAESINRRNEELKQKTHRFDKVVDLTQSVANGAIFALSIFGTAAMMTKSSKEIELAKINQGIID